MRIKRPLKERLLENIIPEPNSGCWLWTGPLINKDGYGSIKVDGISKMPHRLSYQVFKDDIPKGLYVLHKCDTPCCINPDHLFVGTAKENTEDMIKKNRKFIARGELSGTAKLKEIDIIKIRAMTQYKNVELAKMFNVTDSAISNIRRRKKWAHVP